MSAQTGPFFAFVHYFDAHFPYTPQAPWDTRYDPDYKGTLDGRDRSLDPYRRGEATPSPRDVEHILALYDGELSELDAALAPLLAAIPQDAVVIITADHGESFEHDYWFNHRGAFGRRLVVEGREPRRILEHGAGLPRRARGPHRAVGAHWTARSARTCPRRAHGRRAGLADANGGGVWGLSGLGIAAGEEDQKRQDHEKILHRGRSMWTP